MANHRKDACSVLAVDFVPVNRNNTDHEKSLIAKYLKTNKVKKFK